MPYICGNSGGDINIMSQDSDGEDLLDDECMSLDSAPADRDLVDEEDILVGSGPASADERDMMEAGSDDLLEADGPDGDESVDEFVDQSASESRIRTGGWLAPDVALAAQAKAMIAKAYSSITGLPKHLILSIATSWGLKWSKKHHLAKTVVMSMFDCSGSRLSAIIGNAGNFASSCPRDPSADAAAWEPKCDETRNVLETLCSRALASGVEGAGLFCYERSSGLLLLQAGERGLVTWAAKLGERRG